MRLQKQLEKKKWVKPEKKSGLLHASIYSDQHDSQVHPPIGEVKVQTIEIGHGRCHTCRSMRVVKVFEYWVDSKNRILYPVCNMSACEAVALNLIQNHIEHPPAAQAAVIQEPEPPKAPLSLLNSGWNHRHILKD
jgi:hypothetical protein